MTLKKYPIFFTNLIKKIPGSFADEPHPRRLARMSEMSQKCDALASPRRCDTLMTSQKKGGDVFDEHIEEMMKIIVVQGKRICEELKRVQQVNKRDF